jgi:hypothetical protein
LASRRAAQAIRYQALITTIEARLVLRQLGQLHADDQNTLRHLLALVLG